MNKKELQKIIRESIVPNPALSVVSDRKKIDTLKQNTDQLGGIMDKLKTMGAISDQTNESIEDNSIIDDDNNDNFYKELIDKLLFQLFNFTYFDSPTTTNVTNNLKKYKIISQMNSNEFDSFKNDMTQFNMRNALTFIDWIKNSLLYSHANDENKPTDVFVLPLKDIYLKLQNLSQKSKNSKINENNLVDSEIFSIIVESETPKISKKEILEFINKK